MQSVRSPYNPIHLISGLVIWSLWFIALYGGQSVACSIAPPALAQGAWTWLNLTLGLFSLLTVGILLLLARLFQRAARRKSITDREHFVASVSAWVMLVSAVAVAFIALPILGLPPCD